MGCGIEGVFIFYGILKATQLCPWFLGIVTYAAGIASSYSRYSILNFWVFSK